MEAGWILRTFAYYIRNGLIPNMFPEGEKEGIYNTADATLWFFHAIDRYLEYTGDRTILLFLLPVLQDIIARHLDGTDFGIGIDPRDGLLYQGKESYALTWMDAKVEDWVVTPRRGKAVEINALWYNALRLLEQWVSEEQGEEAARFLAQHADRVMKAFNQRFWYEEGGYLYDVIDGSATIDRDDGTFGFSHIPYFEDLDLFLEKATEELIEVRTSHRLIRSGIGENVIHFSALPWLRFTHVSHPRRYARRDSIPKITIGKFRKSGEKRLIPVSVHVNHAVADGLHVGMFFDTLQKLFSVS